MEEACWFYANKSGTIKEAVRNLTNGLENTPTHQQYKGKLVKQLELDALGPNFSSPSPSIYPNSNFPLMFNVSFFKISSGLLTSLYQPNYPRATSNLIRLSKTSQSCETTRFQISSYMENISSEDFSLVGYKKDSIRKGGQ